VLEEDSGAILQAIQKNKAYRAWTTWAQTFAPTMRWAPMLTLKDIRKELATYAADPAQELLLTGEDARLMKRILGDKGGTWTAPYKRLVRMYWALRDGADRIRESHERRAA
jgi:hypothetical protein